MLEPMWAALLGDKGSNKSAVAAEIVGELARAGLRVRGFLQRTDVDPAGRQGFELVRLAGGDRLALAREGLPERPGTESFCSFTFQTDAFARARAWIEADAPGAEVLVVDEASKLEAAGRGHAGAIEVALAAPALALLCVRADQLHNVMERFALDEPLAQLEVPCDLDARAAFVAAVTAAARGPARPAAR